MPSVVHVVTTENFAGVERYVADAATETAARGWDVAVVGGHPERMPAALGDDVRWLPGASPLRALQALAQLGRYDVCHAHMTVAETVAVASRPRHRARIVVTRHFAARRGSSRVGRLAAPVISAFVDREIAISNFVAAQLEKAPDVVIGNGVRLSDPLWRPSSRTVLVLQRLEAEKDTITALRAWQLSDLAADGWSLRVVGDGSERSMLERWVEKERASGVAFAGWRADVGAEFSEAGVLLAPAPAEPFGLGVVEAMAAGVPVVACAAGGHLETVGLLADAPKFPARDAQAAATALRGLVSDEKRASLSAEGRKLVAESFTISLHVDQLLQQYELAFASSRRRAKHAEETALEMDPNAPMEEELVVCSLEAWDDVWRRNQFFTDNLLRADPRLRVLFVEPPADPLHDLACRRTPSLPRLRKITGDGRLRAFRPLKVLPRRFGPFADAALRAQVVAAARMAHFSRPTLWVNDVTYAPLIPHTGWPSVYDVTDDWLHGPFGARELERLRRLDSLAVETAGEVVVCSPALAESRGDRPKISLIPNGVDVEHFRRPRPRPLDLPAGPVAAYVGTLHEARLDIELLVDLARSLPELRIALVGPDSLGSRSRAILDQLPNVYLLGPRPYEDVPAYLQHADVIVIPHRISPFTESLDPIKAYECLALDTQVVATPVAGFREHGEELGVVDAREFVGRVQQVISTPARRSRNLEPPSWNERAAAFQSALDRASQSAPGREGQGSEPRTTRGVG